MQINLTNELAICDREGCANETYWRVAWDETDPIHPLCGTCLGL